MAAFCDVAFTEIGVGELNLTSNWLWFWIFIWFDFGRLGDRWFRFLLKLKTFYGSIELRFWCRRHFFSLSTTYHVSNINSKLNGPEVVSTGFGIFDFNLNIPVRCTSGNRKLSVTLAVSKSFSEAFLEIIKPEPEQNDG